MSTGIIASLEKMFKKSKFKNVDATLKCQNTSCSEKSRDLVSFLAHLRGHAEDGIPVSCPFRGCEKSFSIKSSFSSHLSRKHRTWSLCLLSQSVHGFDSSDIGSTVNTDTSDTNQTGSPPELSNESPDDEIGNSDDELEANSVLPVTDHNQYLRSVALLYLKLQAKFLLPSSTIQNIIEEYQEISGIGRAHLFSKLQENLADLNIPESDVQNLIKELSKQDLLSTFNTGVLRSDQSRTTFFQREFDYVEPVEIYLGQDNAGKQRYCQYVPITKTLSVLLKQNEVKRQYQQTRDIVPKENIFEDVSDGKVFLSNKLFQEQLRSLQRWCPSPSGGTPVRRL